MTTIEVGGQLIVSTNILCPGRSNLDDSMIDE